MARLSVRTETWIACAQIAARELAALDGSPNLMAWFEREYEWPALYEDEGGQM